METPHLEPELSGGDSEPTNITTWYIEMDSTLRTAQTCLDVVEITQGVLIVLCNAFVLGLIFTERKKFTTHLSNIHIVSLLCSDLIQGLINVPITVFLSSGVTLSHPLCFHAIHLASTTGFSQVLIILAMTTDRYWAIVHPLHYKTKATVRNSVGTYNRVTEVKRCCTLYL